jgi:site-specific recombinase XerD
MLEELQRRNYSSETIRGYIFAVREFAEHYSKSPEAPGAEELRHYQVHLLQKRKPAPNTVEGRISALRFLYKKVLKRRNLTFDDLTFPKTPKKLPVVLSHQ